MKTTVRCDTKDGKTAVFTRLTEEEARELFNEGATISVMTDDRNPSDTIVMEIDYTKGEELFWNAQHEIACKFEQVKKDFAEWLESDGYNHNPEREKAESYSFSYWVCNLEMY